MLIISSTLFNRVWVPDQNQGFVQGYVVKEELGKSTIALASGELVSYSL